MIEHEYKKLIKNHAFIHDACSFLIHHLEIGPGYVYGIFYELMVVSSAGRFHS